MPIVVSEETVQYLNDTLLQPAELTQRSIDGSLRSTDVVCDVRYKLTLTIGTTFETFCTVFVPKTDEFGNVTGCQESIYLKRILVDMVSGGAILSKTCQSVCGLMPSTPGCVCNNAPPMTIALPPEADPLGRICAPSGKTTVMLEGRVDPPPGSGPLTYSWSLTSPTTSDRSASGAVAAFTLDRGQYQTTFLARNEITGCTSTVSRTVTVDGPPLATLTVPPTKTLLSTDGFVDISGDAEDIESTAVEPLRVSWSVTAAGGAPLHPQDVGSPGKPRLRMKLDPGVYDVVLTAKDRCDSQSQATVRIKVGSDYFCRASTARSSDAAQSGLPNTRVSVSGLEEGAGLLFPEAGARTPVPGCTRTSACEACEDDGCEGSAGDPVFLASGVLAEYHSDLGWVAPGANVQFRRAYMSNRDRSGQLGIGWAHGYESFLEESGNDVTVSDWRGGTLLFRRDVGGEFSAAEGGGATLSRAPSGEWNVRFAVGAENRYRADGKLSAMVDATGHGVTMEYSAAGDLVRVVDSAGGALELEVVGGLIRSATAKNGDRVRFAYTADRRLAVATSQDGHATSYTYAAGSGLLQSIQRPTTGEGSLTQSIEYNAAGQVTRVAATTGDGAVSVNSFGYPDATTRAFTAADGQTYTFKVNAQGRLVERVDPNGDTYRIDLDEAGRTTKRVYPDGTHESWAYDAQGRLASYTSRKSEVTRVERDPATGHPVALIRTNGSREEREERGYDAAGNLVRTKNAVGEETLFTRNSRGQVTEVRGPGGVTRYEYDPSGNVSKVIDAAGQATTYERDTLGREIAVTTPGGRTTRTEYCTCGQKSASIDAEGNRTEFEYDAMGELVKTKLPNGGTIENTYIRRNGFNLVASVKDAMGNVSRTEYDAVGRAVAHVDALGRRTSYELDVVGRVVKVNLPGGNFSLTRYNAAGRVSETENARGAVTRFEYDADGRVTRTILPDGSSSSQEYDGVGRVVKRISADGAVEQLVYDAAGRVIATIDALGKISQTHYGPSGVVTKTVNARGKATTFEHDVLDRLVKTTNALGLSSRQEYNAEGETVLTVNVRGAETRFAFDRNGRLVETTDALGGKVRKQFDGVGNMIRVEDERGNAWTFAYDLNQRRIRETDPLGRSTHYTFNALELVKVRHADGSEWQYTHDAAGRVVSRMLRNAAGAIEDTETFSYDIVGNRTKVENGAVIVTSEHDIMDREVKRTTVWKRTGATRELRFTHDARGRRQAMFDSHGRVMRYDYDKLSRPVKLTLLEPNPRSTGIADAFFPREYAFTWDDISNLVEVKYPNGTRTRREFDDIDRLTKLVHERDSYTLASWTIERDAQGNPTKIVREDGDVWTMDHDLGDRLTRVALPRALVARLRAHDAAKGKGKPERDDDEDEDSAEKLMRVGEVVYRYDAAHNRTEEVYGGRAVRSTFDAVNQMLTRGTMRFRYNERGDQVEKLHNSGRREVFSYTASGKLASYATGHAKSRQLKEVERYVYSPSSERVLVEDVQGKMLRHSHWDGHRPIEEWSEIGHGSGKKEKGELFLRDLGGQLLETAKYNRRAGRSKHECEEEDFDDWSDDDDRRGDRDGDGVRKPKPVHVRWAHPDFLGSTALVTNHRGRVLDRLSYGPWGENLEGSRNKVRFGFTGHAWESQTGHWSALHRQLDPRAGRWSQRDPVGSIDGHNRYRYARNGPFGMVDGSGLYAEIKDDGATIKIIIPVEFFKGTKYVVNPWTGENAFVALPKDYDIGPDVQRMMEQMTHAWKVQVENKFACEVLPDRGSRRLSVSLRMSVGASRAEGGSNPKMNYFNILRATQRTAFRYGNTAHVAANVDGAIIEQSSTEAHELGHLLNIRDDLLPRSIMTHLERSDTDQVHPAHVEQIVDTWSYHKIKIVVRER